MPFDSPCHFFQAFETEAFLAEYWMRTSWLCDIYFFWMPSLRVRNAIFCGSDTSPMYLTSSECTYSRVLPGHPYTKVKSPSFTPSRQMLKYFLGR